MTIRIDALTEMLKAEAAAKKAFEELSEVERKIYEENSVEDTSNMNNVGNYHGGIAQEFGKHATHTSNPDIAVHAAKLAALHHKAAGHAFNAHFHYLNGKENASQKDAMVSHKYSSAAKDYAKAHKLRHLVQDEYPGY
jgi:hypothetical protein